MEDCALGAVLARPRVRRREAGEAQELRERPARQVRRRAEAEAAGRFHLRDQPELEVPSPGCSAESMRSNGLGKPRRGCKRSYVLAGLTTKLFGETSTCFESAECQLPCESAAIADKSTAAKNMSTGAISRFNGFTAHIAGNAGNGWMKCDGITQRGLLDYCVR